MSLKLLRNNTLALMVFGFHILDHKTRLALRNTEQNNLARAQGIEFLTMKWKPIILSLEA